MYPMGPETLPKLLAEETTTLMIQKDTPRSLFILANNCGGDTRILDDLSPLSVEKILVQLSN